MMRVAVAGYGDLTRYICEEFVKAGHELIILTRAHKPELEKQGIPQAITDYTLQSLKAPLVHCEALISTISDFSPAYTDVHRNLVLACQDSAGCKRFIPAEFAANIEAYPDQPGFYYAPHEPIREMLRSQRDIEWTLMCIGWLADYLVPTKNRYIKNIGKFHPINWDSGKIVIPGTGNEPIDFTWARDVAKGLAALLRARRGAWEPYTFMSGERSCWNDAVTAAKNTFHADIPTTHISLHATVEIIKSTNEEDAMILADYYLLSISHACGNPPDRVRAHKEKYFHGLHYRTLQEGLAELVKSPDSIL